MKRKPCRSRRAYDRAKYIIVKSSLAHPFCGSVCVYLTESKLSAPAHRHWVPILQDLSDMQERCVLLSSPPFSPTCDCIDVCTINLPLKSRP